MARLFGTDGVRGVANKELTPELAFKLGRAGAFVLSAESQHQPVIYVGKDTRISGDMLESALIAGICSTGAKAVSLGIVPTPAVASLVKKHGADAGVVISASHNSFEYNGIKFFGGTGYKLPDEVEDKIEALIHDPSSIPSPVGEELGSCEEFDNAAGEYVDFIYGTIKRSFGYMEDASCNFEGIRLLLDCANGASYKVAPEYMRRMGADVTVINDGPNGFNINKDCGSTHMERLTQMVKDGDYHMGLAFDGDADRLLLVDENGEFVDGDKIMAIIGGYLKKNGQLSQNTIVATILSNMGLSKFAAKEGINIAQTAVGDRYVLEEMLAKGYSLGGEQSGHIILLDHNTTGDGLLTAAFMVSILCATGKKMSELASVMKVYPQVSKNARVKNENKNAYLDNKEIAEQCALLEKEFDGNGRVIIRPSGTEPLVRVMIEGDNLEIMTKKAEELVALIEKHLG